MKKIQPVRGTHDLVGKDFVLYKKIEKIISKIANIYDFIVNNPEFDISFMLKNKLKFPITITKSMIDKFCKKKSTNPSASMYL